MDTKSNKNKTYRTWINMKQRCLNKKHPQYKNYGGRGIKISKKWVNNYDRFLEDMGEKPDNLEIDRENVDGDYNRKNCRWVTKEINLKNKTRPIDYIIREDASANYIKGESGVYFEKSREKWRARASVRGKQIHVGYFRTETEARVRLKDYTTQTH